MKYKIVLLCKNKKIRDFFFETDFEEEVLQYHDVIYKHYDAVDSYIEVDYESMLKERKEKLWKTHTSNIQ